MEEDDLGFALEDLNSDKWVRVWDTFNDLSEQQQVEVLRDLTSCLGYAGEDTLPRFPMGKCVKEVLLHQLDDPDRSADLLLVKLECLSAAIDLYPAENVMLLDLRIK
eukprot:Trichotokara_eunicae@DN8831_c0_g1_i1.p1